jgi:hypothetical protein
MANAARYPKRNQSKFDQSTLLTTESTSVSLNELAL